MGLRSMKVKRLREEMAARAKELFMQAASAAAGKEKRTKKMLAAAIKIQVCNNNIIMRNGLSFGHAKNDF